MSTVSSSSQGFFGRYTFPAAPSQLDEEKLRRAAEHNLRVLMIAGGNDSRLPRQKALAANLDELGLQKRLVVFSGKEHEFPDDFSNHIDLNLDFLLSTQTQN